MSNVCEEDSIGYDVVSTVLHESCLSAVNDAVRQPIESALFSFLIISSDQVPDRTDHREKLQHPTYDMAMGDQ
jgi:hypothetical protein